MVHTYDGRYYQVPHALVARISCTSPAQGQIAGWAGVSAHGWSQAGVYAANGEAHAYAEQGIPYRLDTRPETEATVVVTRQPLGFYKISLNGRVVVLRAYGFVWAGVERIDTTDGACTVQVTVH